jgi:dTMP kinase
MAGPLFFTFDGIDGTGKSTQSQMFCDWLGELGYEVVTCRDPGTTALGNRLREIVLHGDQLKIGMRAEALIYMAARAQMVEETIQPALAAGQVVVSDRFLLATAAYQGHGLGLSADAVWDLGKFATGGLRPTQTFLLDLDVEQAASRLQASKDRLEKRGADYFARVREGFLTEARRFPDCISVIDASQSVDEVQAAIRQAAAKFVS